ncbi:hypothetical protein HT102_06455 [Hoyosella sp. G463]|uniref:Uncharacterized protein n=1 Tax=Lolliginicoccus lacisalsi TaxID=2742202 RepID=A0A927PKK8_9ACTN|nr:hypothetical protein [Lolliginicoccus lacisalsi]MBD8506120.1 hypothetical protein [Lolliginicoccus lacisalsi]
MSRTAGNAPSWGILTDIQINDGAMLPSAEPPFKIQMQHYALLVDDGRGVYFRAPAGHGIELITHPYF